MICSTEAPPRLSSAIGQAQTSLSPLITLEAARDFPGSTQFFLLNVTHDAAPRKQGDPYLPGSMFFFKASCRGCFHIKIVRIVVLNLPHGLIGKVGDGVACRVCTKDLPSGELYVIENPAAPPIEEREGWLASRNSRNSKAPT